MIHTYECVFSSLYSSFKGNHDKAKIKGLVLLCIYISANTSTNNKRWGFFRQPIVLKREGVGLILCRRGAIQKPSSLRDQMKETTNESGLFVL